MKNRNNRNFLTYSLLVIVTIIVYLVIHISFGAISKEIYQCNAGVGNNNIYTVKTGDSLEELARRFNIPIEKLREVNNLKENDVLYPGQEIIIPVDDGSSIDKQPTNNIITTKENEEPVKIEKIELSSNKITMAIGDKKKLYVAVEPSNASKSDLVWVSSDPSIATVDKYGNIVALKEGTVTITVKTKDGSVSESCTIVVKKVPVDKIILNPTTLSVKVNSSASIVAIIKPSNATVDELIWESSDPSVARVDNNGRVTGIKEGTATITARTPDGKVTATCVVNIVSNIVPATGIKLDSDKTSVKVGSSEQLIATIEPTNATERDVIWSSSDPSVVKVDENGKITGVKPGTATITVKTKDGEFEATCVVTVEPIAVDKVTLFPDDLTVKIGSSATITAIIEPDNATDQELIWTSSDPSVAKVDQNGKVTGLKEGTTTITAKTKDGKVKSECTVTVEPIKVNEIKLNPTELSVKVGSSATITATVKPSNATDKELIWESSDPSVAKVDQNGKVTGLKEGTATITAKTKDGKVTSECIVTVESVKVDEITLHPTELSVKVGSSATVVAVIKPDDATDKELIWTSSDPSVAKVDQNGKVTGVSPGTATITAKTKDGEVAATCVVNVVTDTVPVSKITLDQDTVAIDVGETSQLIANIEPENATERDLIWSSSDPSVVTVDENGKITGVKPGTATITVKTKDGTVTDTCIVTVNPIKVDTITLNLDDLTLKVGNSSQLTATISPENATDKELIWTSSDPSIATVDSTGKVTAVKKGNVVITAKTKDGSVRDECNVTVEEDELPQDIVFTYDYDDDNYIYLINQFPISDEIGKNLQGDKRTQDFKLRFNEAAVGVNYVITAEKLDGSDLNEQWAKLFLVNDGADVLNCYRANNRVKSFDEYENYNGNANEKIIYEGTVTASEAARGYKDFTFRMWVSEDLNLVNSNYLSETKTFKTRINVYAVGN